MVGVSEIGIKEEELELELGLSIGGSFRKLSETPKPVERESGFLFDSKSNGFDLDMKEIQATTTATSPSRNTSPTVFEAETAVPDPKTKREIHALRRQEAKKKQKEKRCRARNSNINSSDSQTGGEDQQRASKREKTAGSNGVNGVGNGFPNSINGGQTVHYGPVGPAAMQYHYETVQFFPYTNGFAYPCVVPCWAPSTPLPGGNEKNGVFQPVALRGFRPFVAARPSFGLSFPNGCESEKSGGKDVENRKTASYGSPVCSSSTVSDLHHSSSHEGDGSSETETRTHSSQSSAEQKRVDGPKPNDIKSHSSEVQSPSLAAQTNNIDQFKEQAKPGFDSSALENPMPTSLLKDMGKPPRPQSLNRNLTPPPMPYVSTRGNGPNGKTINGFLYRYTNSEVSIVCVCHGSTFSPSEFVQHAGGTDVSHPLKHITVIPFAFG